MSNVFNYIVPIFNKEDVLPMTLNGIDVCASREARIYTVIDGCTDGSERVVDEFMNRTGRHVIKIHMPDVHMLRSVNSALKMIKDGFSVVMQDDIILKDRDFEQKILDLYSNMGDRLGVISLRLAANIELTPVLKRLSMRSLHPMIRETGYIMSEDDNQSYSTGQYEKFYPRMGAINGPNIIPWRVLEKVGILDEALAPYGYDDADYGLRAMKAGFINGMFPLKFQSDLAWGGTRRSKKFMREVRRIHARNRKYIWGKHADYIQWLWKTGRVMQENNSVNSLAAIPNCQLP
ncbi:glycosyltransferase [Aquabacterium sp. CECT 9606]|uniref:glycosyltransferase family 2 protein n=1 Tax=Aquabacterium sp. CECT 9606 TaxID=2845822 RepID=UPI001EF9C821|nr:glycosyltransferase [Aquabacterium sp. CECT 9606]CAH0354100.1 hypothetical protein AQB9606_03487 [Aquabacterium sp. CECT 9606]